jgi:hypothetical protein
MGGYLHFTTLAPGNWSSSARCHTLRDQQNLYWLKLFSRAAYDQDFQRAMNELGEAGSIPAGQADAVAHAMAGKRYLLDCMRELLFESVREEVAPHLPSRSRCLFLIENGADLEASARRYGFRGPDRTVLEIEGLEGSLTFRGQASLLDTGPIVTDIMESARRYWAGAPPVTPLDDVEVLFTGPFRIASLRRAGDGPALYIDGKGLAELFNGDFQTQS